MELHAKTIYRALLRHRDGGLDQDQHERVGLKIRESYDYLRLGAPFLHLGISNPPFCDHLQVPHPDLNGRLQSEIRADNRGVRCHLWQIFLLLVLFHRAKADGVLNYCAVPAVLGVLNTRLFLYYGCPDYLCRLVASV